MTDHQELSMQDLTKSLCHLWEPLTREQRILLEENLHIRHYKRNEAIYKEKEKPEWLFCVLEGKVKIYRSGVGRRCQIMRMVQSGEYFGYRAFFAHERQVTSASAFDNALICTVPMTIIDRLVKANNQLSYFFIQQLAHDLGRSDVRIVSLTQKHIRGRLAENLLLLKEKYGLEEDGATINIYLSREDLANLSNMTTANAIRTLSNFSNERLIAIDGRKIKIIDEEGLYTISRHG